MPNAEDAAGSARGAARSRPDGQALRKGSAGAGGRGRPAAAGKADDARGAAGRGDAARGGAGGRSAASAAGDRGRRGATPDEIAQRTYDPRREERRKATRVALPEDVDPRDLDPEARRELRGLSKETADLVARHLVMTGRLLDEDPNQALTHARAARALGGRIAVVREAAGFAAYAAGEWTEALSDLRAARRISGSPEHLAVLADCERALGRPERALAYAQDPQLSQLTQDQRVELVIVLSGARRDLGQPDAAVLELQDPARRTTERRPWAVRLWYAYADALLGAGREQEAREWFSQAAAADVDGETDAGDRLLALDGFVLEDPDDDERADHAGLPNAQELADLVRDVRPAAVLARDDAQLIEGPDAATDPGESVPALGLPSSGVRPPPFVAPDDHRTSTD